jgi:hypothetical protein
LYKYQIIIKVYSYLKVIKYDSRLEISEKTGK